MLFVENVLMCAGILSLPIHVTSMYVFLLSNTTRLNLPQVMFCHSCLTPLNPVRHLENMTIGMHIMLKHSPYKRHPQVIHGVKSSKLPPLIPPLAGQ